MIVDCRFIKFDLFDKIVGVITILCCVYAPRFVASSYEILKGLDSLPPMFRALSFIYLQIDIIIDPRAH